MKRERKISQLVDGECEVTTMMEMYGVVDKKEVLHRAPPNKKDTLQPNPSCRQLLHEPKKGSEESLHMLFILRSTGKQTFGEMS